jgi:hypothetical protein
MTQNVYVDLSPVLRGISVLGDSIRIVHQEVDDVRDRVIGTASEVAELRAQLAAFEERYNRQTEVGHAETRLVKVRQKLETTYGHYADIRRAATGVLQAADVNVIRNETVNSVTEELMLLAPGYWLAPALVALAAWLRDDRTLAERALQEALRRDDEKVSLFFALVCRRGRRSGACMTWLDRYLLQQNPRTLKRQAIILVDGAAGGVFPPEAQHRCAERFGAWIDELSGEPGFLEQQREQWRDALRGLIPAAEYAATYPHLAQICTEWALLESLTNRISLGAALEAHLRGIFDGELASADGLAAAVDGVLANLVAEHDSEELPLRREEAQLQAIINADGRLDVANQRYAAEAAALEDESSFTQLLTNAAMNAELTGATRVSQRFAVALSRDWLRDAFGDLVVETHDAVPASVELVVDGWSGRTTDGSNEDALAGELDAFIAAQEEEAVAAIRLMPVHIAVASAGAMVVLYSLVAGLWLLVILGLVAGGWVGYEYLQLEPRRQAVRDDYARRRQAAGETLRAAVAELVEWRRDFADRDRRSKEAEAYIAALQPDAHLLTPHDRTRMLVAGDAS